jgi:pyrophosphatase PpaX
MNTASIKAVVFDLDGTLVEFNLDYKRLRSEVIAFLNRLGLPSSVFSMNDRITSIVEKAERLMANTGKSKEEIREMNREIFSKVDIYEMAAARTTRMFPSVIPTLKLLKERHLKMGIFTLNGRKQTEYLLERFHLEKFFDAVVSREDTRKVKPNPEHLEVVLKMLGSKPKETIVLGDGEADMRCAEQLGAIAVGFANERTPVNQLISGGANYVISSFSDLLTLVSSIGNCALEGFTKA